MWAPWAVFLTLGFLGTLTNGDYGLAAALGLLLIVDLAVAAYLKRTGRRPATS